MPDLTLHLHGRWRPPLTSAGTRRPPAECGPHRVPCDMRPQERGVHLVVLDQGIDTSTATARVFFQIPGVIAEFEHALTSERMVDDGRPNDRAGAGSCRRAEARAHPQPGRHRPGHVRRSRARMADAVTPWYLPTSHNPPTRSRNWTHGLRTHPRRYSRHLTSCAPRSTPADRTDT
jgi:hypothetical protein